MVVGITKIKVVSTMTRTGKKLVKEFKKFETNCLIEKKVMTQTKMTDLQRPLEVLASDLETTKHQHKMMQMSNQASTKYLRSFKKTSLKYQMMP